MMTRGLVLGIILAGCAPLVRSGPMRAGESKLEVVTRKASTILALAKGHPTRSRKTKR